MLIFHITSQAAWQEAQQKGNYTDKSLFTEGFIHCSTKEQFNKVGKRHFSGQKDLILLSIDVNQLTTELKYEVSTDSELYPHLYGSLNIDAVIKTEPIYFL